MLIFITYARCTGFIGKFLFLLFFIKGMKVGYQSAYMPMFFGASRSGAALAEKNLSLHGFTKEEFFKYMRKILEAEEAEDDSIDYTIEMAKKHYSETKAKRICSALECYDTVKDKAVQERIKFLCCCALECFSDGGITTPEEEGELLDEIALLADVENTAKGLYTLYYTRPSFSQHTSCLPNLSQNAVHSRTAIIVHNGIKKTKIPPSKIADDSGKMTGKFQLGYKDFQFPRREALEKYLYTYRDDKKLCEYLYEKFYLDTLPNNDAKSQKQKLLDIVKKYGTYVFFTGKFSKIEKDLMDELESWKKAGGDRVIFPRVLEINPLRTILPPEDGDYAGVATEYSAFLKSKTIDRETLRHEITHLNTDDFAFGVFGGFDFRENGEILTKKQFYRDEFRKGGIPEKGINYAYEDKREFLATAAEGDMSQYSDEFKEVLLKLGMKYWMFKLDKIEE